jgi:hypothetical protein
VALIYEFAYPSMLESHSPLPPKEILNVALQLWTVRIYMYDYWCALDIHKLQDTGHIERIGTREQHQDKTD